MPPSNNVIRLLQSRKIVFEAYELPPEKLGARETAGLLNVPIETVIKTIVIVREKPGKPILAVIPGDREADLKAIARLVGEKKVHLPTEREAERLTGLQAGGISPLALLNRGFQVLLDSSVQTFEHVHVSGGQRGLNIRLPVSALISLINPRLGEIAVLTT